MAISPVRCMRAVGVGVAGGLMLAGAHEAEAAFSLQVDLNSLTGEFAPPAPLQEGFGTSATGVVTLTQDADSVLAGMKRDEVGVPFGASLSFLSMNISLLNGAVVGGDLDLILDDGSRYVASITEDSGRVITQAGQGFAIDGLTFSGAFFNLVGGTQFGGVDVSDLGGRNLFGSFLAFAFDPQGPNELQSDTDTDLDLWIRPIPGPAGLSVFALAGGLAAARRRRG